MDRLERELTTWFVDTALPRTPHYTDDILRQTARVRQRPRWTFLERWLPMRGGTLERMPVKPLPWRTIGLLAVLALLLAATVAFYVGSEPRLPAPFGPAANGLVAYAKGGDIFTVDPITGTRRAIVTGPEWDHDPRWSLDGTRLAFLRQRGGGDVVVIADAEGKVHGVSDGDPLINLDTDGVAWSPDGGTIAVLADGLGSRAVYFVDASDGVVTTLAADYVGLEVHWRPPDGRELMFLGGTSSNPGLFLYSMDDGSAREIPISDGDRSNLRPGGWTPDGRRFAFHVEPTVGGARTLLVDVGTGAETVIDAGFGHLSNDGGRIVAFDGTDARNWLCVAQIAGGPCVRIGTELQAPAATHFEGLRWSPDDRWIVTHAPGDGPAVLLDPDGGNQTQPFWPADGADSWQRVTP